MTTEEIQRNVAIRQLLKDSGVPSRYERAVFASDSSGRYLKITQVLQSLTSLPAGESSILVLCGENTYRRGKTYLGCAAVRDFCKRNRPAIYANATTILATLRESFNPRSEMSTTGYLKKLTTPDLLVIDEFHLRSDVKWENDLFRSLVNERHNQLRSTILIGNVKREDLATYLGPAIVFRINECKHGGAFVCDWTPWWTNESN